MSVIAIDLGASRLKAGVFCPPSNQPCSVISRPSSAPDLNQHPGVRELDPFAIFDDVLDLAETLLDSHQNCEALMLCGQMHSTLLVDPGGAPLSPLYSWQDTRALYPGNHEPPTYESTLQILTDHGLHTIGNEFGPGHPASILHHLFRTGQLPTSARITNLLDWVAGRLTGSFTFPCDPSQAAATGLWNVTRQTWHAPLVRDLGLAGLHLPAVLPWGSFLGTFRSRSGQHVPVHVPIGDHPCAILGTNLLEGDLSLNIGTGSQISLKTPHLSPGPWKIRPFPGMEWLLTYTHIPAGRALNALFRLLTTLITPPPIDRDALWGRIETLAAQSTTGGMKVDLAFFPCHFGSEGRLEHLTEENLNPGALFHAAYEAMADNYLRLAETFDLPYQRLVLSGGMASRSPTLVECLRTAFNLPCCISSVEEQTLAGLFSLWSDHSN